MKTMNKTSRRKPTTVTQVEARKDRIRSTWSTEERRERAVEAAVRVGDLWTLINGRYPVRTP